MNMDLQDLSRHQLLQILAENDALMNEAWNRLDDMTFECNDLKRQNLMLEKEVLEEGKKRAEAMQRLQRAIEEQENAEKALRGSQDQQKDLRKNLDEFMTKILWMQPRDHRSDDQIRDSYYFLYHGVSDWVSETFLDVSANISYICHHGRTNNLTLNQRKVLNKVNFQVAKVYPASECSVIAGVVFRFLFDAVFDNKRPYHGFSNEINQVLLRLIQGVRAAQPQRGVYPLFKAQTNAYDDRH